MKLKPSNDDDEEDEKDELLIVEYLHKIKSQIWVKLWIVCINLKINANFKINVSFKM